MKELRALRLLDRDEFIHPGDWERVTGHVDGAVSSGAGFELELLLTKGDGSYRWFYLVSILCATTRDR